MPLLLILSLNLAPKSNFRWIPGVAAILVIGCLVAREVGGPETLFETHARCDALFVGVFLGWLHHFRTLQMKRKNWLLLVPLGCNILPLIPGPYYLTWGLLFNNSIGSSALLVWALNTP